MAKLGIVAVVVVVLGAVGYFAWQGLSSDGTGADSPEAAVEAVATSLRDDDLVGLMASLDPDEVGPLAELSETTLQKAGELELLEVTDTGLAQLDIDVQGLQLSVEELHPEVAKVTIEGGSLGADFTSPDLGLAVAFEDQTVLLSESTAAGETSLVDLMAGDEEPVETFVVAVERDGGWYLSPLYTLAEWIRESEGLAAADFEASRGDVEGADSPTAAVEQFADAVEGLDAEAGVAALPPGEFGFARDYLEAVLPEVDQGDLAETRAELQLTIDDLQLREGDDLGGGRRIVEITGLTFTFEDEYEGRTEVVLEGRCATVTNEEDDPSSSCLEEWMAQDASLDPALADLLPEVPYVVAVEADGGWYVSPMETVAAYLGDALEALSDEHLAALGVVEPQPLTAGEPVEGELATVFRRAVYTTELTDQELYSLSLSADAAMGVYAHPIDGDAYSDGAARFWTDMGDDTTSARLFTAVGGEYAVTVQGDTYAYGDDDLPEGPLGYTLDLAPVEVAGAIELGEPVEVDPAEGETVAYTYESAGDETVNVAVDGDAVASLMNPFGYQPFLSEEEGTSLSEAGTWYVAVTGTGTDAGPVTLEISDATDALIIEPPDSLDEIPEIELDAVERVTLEEYEIVDFVFEGTGGEMTVIAAADDDEFDPILVVFDSDLEWVVQNEGDAAERRAESTLETVEGELYVLSVSGYEGAGGDVRVRVVGE